MTSSTRQPCEQTGQRIGEGLRRGEPVSLRVRGFSLLPAVPPGATVELAVANPRRLAHGELVVVEIRGSLVCHLLESGDGTVAAPLVTRGLWALAPDPPVSRDALVGVVAAVRLLGLRVPTTGAPFRAWLALGRLAAPAVRSIRATAWSHVPAAVKKRLRRGLRKGGG